MLTGYSAAFETRQSTGVGMGIDVHALRYIEGLKTAGHLEGVERIMELGAQYVHANARDLQRFAFSFGRPLREVSNARDLYEMIGLSFACLDTSGEFGAITLDLNFEPLPDEHVAAYDLVTNHGTTEHIFNQAHAFTVIHDLTCKGGLMMHALPYTGYTVHGFFNYTPKLFWALAAANGYELIDVSGRGEWLPTVHYRTLLKHIKFNLSPWLFPFNSLLYCTLRKTQDAPFVFPWDGRDQGMKKPQKDRYARSA